MSASLLALSPLVETRAGWNNSRCFDFLGFVIFFCFFVCSPSRQEERAHPVDQLSDHARPGAVGLRGPVQAVVHQLDLKRELQDVRQLPQHVDAEALVLVVALEVLVVVFAHHVRVLLNSGGEGRLEREGRFSHKSQDVASERGLLNKSGRLCSIYIENDMSIPGDRLVDWWKRERFSNSFLHPGC